MSNDYGTINLDGRYCIEVDNLNYTLKEMKTIKTGKREGEQVADPVGYYGSITDALEAYADRIIREQMKGKSMDLSEAVRQIRESSDRVSETIRKVCK